MDLGCGGPCGACKFLRRKCVKGCCIFAPYFESSSEGSAKFAALHKVFGASNASKLLMRIPLHNRLHAVLTLSYEALARTYDPIYGSAAHIFALQQQIMELQAELAYLRARLSILNRISEFEQAQTSSIHSSILDHHLSSNNESTMHLDHNSLEHKYHPTPFELSNFHNPSSYYIPIINDQELQEF